MTQREIKFRVWLIEEKAMALLLNINFEKNEGEGILLDGSGIRVSQIDLTKNPLLQFTGLKDKNGKEIYEGDIVESKYADETSLSNEIRLKYLIEWDNLNNKWTGIQPRKGDGKLLDNIYSGGLSGQDLNKDWNIEVIGNTYENPELLK